MRGLLWRWLVTALRLCESRIVLKAKGLAVDRLLDRTVRRVTSLALAAGVLGGSRKTARPGARLGRAKRNGAKTKQDSDRNRQHRPVHGDFPNIYPSDVKHLRRGVATLATIDSNCRPV